MVRQLSLLYSLKLIVLVRLLFELLVLSFLIASLNSDYFPSVLEIKLLFLLSSVLKFQLLVLLVMPWVLIDTCTLEAELYLNKAALLTLFILLFDINNI
jgi:hypothetical protein